jgi:O-antigen/teichoic acid export membrane protein/peptidoglycan/xylan/chitin deacetylase (PgdA/CDA1 family)
MFEKLRYEDEGEGFGRGDPTGRDRLAWNVLSSWGCYIVFIVAGFIMPRFIDRHIGQTALGVWDFGWSLVSYLGLTPLGIGAAVNRYVAWYRSRKDLGALNQAVSSVMFVQILAAAAGLALTAAATWALPALLNDHLGAMTGEARWMVLFLGLSVCIQIGFNTFRGIITGCHRWDLNNAVNGSSYAATVVGMAVALTLGGGLRSLALTYLCGTVLTEVARAVMALKICPELRLRWASVSWGHIRSMAGFGLKTVLLHISTLLLYQTNSMVIAAYLGPAFLALYSRPMNLVRHVNTIISKFAMVLVPTTSALQAYGKAAELRELVVGSGRFGAFLALPMIVGLGIMGGPILRLWMGPAYDQGLVLAVLAVGHLLPITQEPVTNILTAMNLHGRLSVASLIASSAGIAMGVIAVRYLGWGLVGAAVAVTVPLIVCQGIYAAHYTCKHVGLPLGEYARRALTLPILCAIPFAVSLIISRFILASKPAAALGWGCAAGAAVLSPLYWRWALPAEARDRTVSLLRKLLYRAWAGMRPAIRNLCYHLPRWSGFLWFYRFRHRHEVAILTIHGTGSPESQVSWMPLRPQLHPDRLEASIRVLTRYCRFVSLDEAVDMLTGKVPPRPYSVVLTFDDGYRNNMTRALPILRRYGIPATIFIATGHVEERKPFWVDRLDYALQHAPIEGRIVRVGRETICLRATDREALAASYRELRDAARTAQRHDTEMLEELEGMAARLEAESGRRLDDRFESDEWSAVLTWDEIRTATAGGVSFGSHTVDHVRLGRVDEAMIRDQLVRSKATFESRTGTTCRHLCYPDGSYNERVAAIARACGYVAALTVESGMNRVGDDPMTLRRIPFPHTDDPAEVLAVASGLPTALRRARAWLTEEVGARWKTPSRVVATDGMGGVQRQQVRAD